MRKEIKMKIDNKQWKWTREPKDLWVKLILMEVTAKDDHFFFLVKIR